MSASLALIVFETLIVLIALVAAPAYAIRAQRGRQSDADLRGLNLPRGSIRAMLALLLVGSFVNVLLFGAPLLGEEFGAVVTALSAVTASVLGFYFGNRGAARPPGGGGSKTPA